MMVLAPLDAYLSDVSIHAMSSNTLWRSSQSTACIDISGLCESNQLNSSNTASFVRHECFNSQRDHIDDSVQSMPGLLVPHTSGTTLVRPAPLHANILLMN